jgi:phosphopantothenoylcysteine synthetase/decarboxylase
VAEPPSIWDPESIEPIRFSGQRLLVVGSGSVSAAFLPFWLNWVRHTYPELTVQVVLTRSAQRFVTGDALSGLTGRAVLTDEWPVGPNPRALHVHLAQWPQAIAVYPATMHLLARFALGLADTPTLLALHCTKVPIALAAALPPGCWDSPAMARHRTTLAELDNVAVLPPVPGLSMTTGEHTGSHPDTFAKLLGRLESLRSGPPRASSGGDGPPAPPPVGSGPPESFRDTAAAAGQY